LGNENPIHSLLARPATSLIDTIAYNGRNIRQEMLDNFTVQDNSVIDLCCGTGMSTPYGATGVDISMSMLREARWRRGKLRGCTFLQGNAEDFGQTNSFDVCTVCFALHEMPSNARVNVMRNAVRIAKKRAIFCDISNDYSSSVFMRMGEPYLLDYQENILDEYLALERLYYVRGISIFSPVPHHVLLVVVDLD
jgi:ubiquinone/menaquinone biosynthesis C-methylase UbiE